MILQFFAAFIGAAGFGFLFHLQFKHIFPAALGGVLTWVIYVIANIWGFDVFISSLFASAFAAIYSEVIAKIRKAPTTLFLIISVVVLIPGGSLYYTMSYAVQRQWQYAAMYGSKTVQCTLELICVTEKICFININHLNVLRSSHSRRAFFILPEHRSS